MKTTVLIGVLLVVLGVIALVYQGFSYTRQKRVFKAGPIEATKKTHEYVPLPPILGAVVLAGGVILIATGARGR